LKVDACPKLFPQVLESINSHSSVGVSEQVLTYEHRNMGLPKKLLMDPLWLSGAAALLV
jgi:hypothetical protein